MEYKPTTTKNVFIHENNHKRMDMISERKLNELYGLYLQSKFICFNQCEQIGLSNKYIQELFQRFEAHKYQQPQQSELQI